MIQEFKEPKLFSFYYDAKRDMVKIEIDNIEYNTYQLYCHAMIASLRSNVHPRLKMIGFAETLEVNEDSITLR